MPYTYGATMSAVKFHKILIIEDDAPIREMYEHKFRAAGHEVKTAADGQVGLAVAAEFLPDIILLDLKMPHVTGAEMLAQLREQQWGQNMRVIVLTNISRAEAPSVLQFLGVDRYIVKAHHTPQQVLDIVEETLN